MDEHTGVLICAEKIETGLGNITFELLGAGRNLADTLGEKLGAVLLGHGTTQWAQELVAFGADTVHVVDDPLLADYQTASYVAAVEKVVADTRPRVLLLGQTYMGRDLAPRLAFRLRTGLSMDCVDLSMDPETKRLLATRPVYGGNVRAIFSTTGSPQMASVRAKAMSPAERDPARSGEVVSVRLDLDPSTLQVRVLDRVKEEVQGVKLEDADVVVCGGRGIGGPEGFKELEKLARVMKGAVAATRPPCDSGWMPTSAQVGLTGKIVAPDVYFAVALSGSSQHMAGCSGAKTLIAVNTNQDANIFKEAQFGVVGDWKQVVPVLAERIRTLLSE